MSVGRLAATAGAEFWRHGATGSSTGAAHTAPAARSSARRVIAAGAAVSRDSSWELDTVDDYRMTGMNPFRMAGAAGALALSCAVVSTAPSPQQPPAAGPARSAWAEWIEPDFPFFSSVIDGGRARAGFPAKNQTPPGRNRNLGRGYRVGFDTDLAFLEQSKVPFKRDETIVIVNNGAGRGAQGQEKKASSDARS